ncbi:hypothetical protein FB45DRAFT_869486 [Roridomyces roridus]|uniref:Uncharacterized protein n=1 Tax=Roridomyces roridus TaxID=1738132 RepID=A0AAD7FHG9_9AGAR|nr:hypothetical protein FB45DRAFT_869486 [Roridomyces roridus]
MPIPQELVDLIIGDLAGDDSSLRSWSLAARSFVRPSQILLFERFDILASAVDNGDGLLLKILTQSPHWGLSSSTCTSLPSSMPTPHSFWESIHDESWDRAIVGVASSQVSWSRAGRFRASHAHWDTMGRQLRAAFTDALVSLESIHIGGLRIHSPKALLSIFSLLRVSGKRGDPLGACFANPQIDLSRLATLSIATHLRDWKDVTRISSLTSLESIEDIATNGGCCVLKGFDPEISFKSNRRTIRIRGPDIHDAMLEMFQCPPESLLESIIFEGDLTCDWSLDPLFNDTIQSPLCDEYVWD